MTDKCVFCEKTSEWIYDNGFFYAIFDAHPVSPGHALIIPKRHVVSILDLSRLEWNGLKEAIEDTIKAVRSTNFQNLYSSMIVHPITDKSVYFCKKMLKHNALAKMPEGYNIGVNDGEAAGRTINHLHIQIIPRYTGDTKETIGGIRSVIPALANYKKPREET
jgi:diadenosine tetraphosphate (Ap4A) HIT family hydrolase